MAYYEVKGLDTIQKIMDAIKDKISAHGYTNITTTDTSIVFEGPTTASGQRWSGYLRLFRQGSQTEYCSSVVAGEGVSSGSLVNSSGAANPLNNGNYNSRTNHSIHINSDTYIQLVITKRALHIRIIGRDINYSNQPYYKVAVMYMLGTTTGEFGSRDFVMCAGPQSKIKSRWGNSWGMGSAQLSTYPGAEEINMRILKFDTSGAKTWHGSRITENGLYGHKDSDNSEKRYTDLLSKMRFPDSLTTVLMPIYIRVGSELYGELDAMRIIPMTYYNTGGSFTLNSKKWWVTSTTDFREDNNAHAGLVFRED